jgi:3-phenylpropionate/trans-cinnamate dioxygenase ferredoxin reductase subunit
MSVPEELKLEGEMDSDVVILGAGQAAMSVARTLRRLGHSARITLVGDEPLAPYERPPLSKQALSATPAPAPVLFTPAEWWVEQDVGLMLSHKAVRIDRAAKRVLMASGDWLCYGRLVIATGGTARALALGTTLRTDADARQLSERLPLSKSLSVIGGGFLGLEIAASARIRGLDVSVFEAAPCLLPSIFPQEFSRWLHGFHAKHGTQVYCGVSVQDVRHTAAGGFAFSTDGVEMEADCLVVAIGMQPNVSLAQDAGLAVDSGIVVDEHCATSDPNIFAVGDVTCSPDPSNGGRLRRVESWQNAEHQGMLAASRIMGVPAPQAPVRWFWTEQYGANIQVLGDLRCGELIWRGTVSDPSFVAVSLLHGRIAGAVGVNAGKDMAPLRQLIAAQGPMSASEISGARSLRELLGLVRVRN